MKSFEPGLDLARAFYDDVVRRLVDRPHAACLLGEGSEVLGYDQPRSTDHQWGPRLQILAAAGDVQPIAASIEAGLPESFRGWPVRFFSLSAGGVAHHVEVRTLESWLTAQLGMDPRPSLSPAAWLAMPQQHLLQVTSGAVFRDDYGDLTAARALLAWYPRDVWLWMMASQWHLIGNTEPLVGRTAEAADPRGSTLVTARLVRLLMQMCFLQERQYWPYDKWFGTAFSRLPGAATVGPLLDSALAANDPHTREQALVSALEDVARRHNTLAVTAPADPTCRDFNVGINNAHRPYHVLNTGRFVTACQDAITDPALRELLPLGAIDQLTHTDDTLINFSPWPPRLAGTYQHLLNEAHRNHH